MMQERIENKERSLFMWEPGTFVSRQEGYIYANYGHYYVMREGVTARNWRELEVEAQDSILSRQWSGDSSPYYPLTRELAQRADFPPRPSELNHYNQLFQQFDIVPVAYDQQERLQVKIHAIAENEQREALEMMKGMSDISPQSIVERMEVSFSRTHRAELPRTIHLQEYLNGQQRTHNAPDFDFDR
jgi:hypothetical protein